MLTHPPRRVGPGRGNNRPAAGLTGRGNSRLAAADGLDAGSVLHCARPGRGMPASAATPSPGPCVQVQQQ